MTGKKLQRVLACLLAVLLLSQVGAFSPAVFAADGSDYTLHDGTAVIPAGTSAGDVNRILAAALVEGFDQMTADEQKAILDTGFEYQCHFTNGKLQSLNSYWGSVAGGTPQTVGSGIFSAVYTCPALAANKYGNYKVRLAGTTQEVTLTKAEKLSSSITLKQGATIALPYKEDGTLDFDALRERIFDQVVESTTPELTVKDVTIKYFASLTTGSITDKDKKWVSLEGESKIVAHKELGYPAISAGKQKIQISYAGNDTYFGTTSQEVMVTFTERPGIEAATNENPTFKLAFTADGEAIYDNIRQQVWDAVVVSTTPALTVDDVTIEYYATAKTGAAKSWMPLEGGTKDWLTYPAIGEGTQEVRITWGGSKDYAAWQWKGNVDVTGRADAPFRLKEGVTEGMTVAMVYNRDQSINYEATAQALRDALLESTDTNISIDDVTVQYNAGIKNYQPLNYSPTGSDFIDQLVKFGLGSQTIHFAWNGNADYKPLKLDDVKVNMEDHRIASAVVLKSGASITYNMDAKVMLQAIFENLIDWDASTLPSKGTLSVADFTIEYYAENEVEIDGMTTGGGAHLYMPLEGGKGGAFEGDLVKSLTYPQMGAGDQKIRVTFKGDEAYRSSTPIEGNLTVNKAKVSVKVHSTSIYAEEAKNKLGAGFVTTDPADKFDIYTIYGGMTSDVTGSVFVQLPERYTNTALIKAIDWALEQAGQPTLTEMMNKGTTVGQLRKILSDVISSGADLPQFIKDALKKANIDIDTLVKLNDALSKLPGLLDNVRVAIGTPDQAGIYTVYAITNNKNYETGVGTGMLLVKKHYSGVKLQWNQTIPNGKLTAEEAKNFDFGVTLMYDGNPAKKQTNVHYLYSGFTSKWKPYSSTTTPPTEPGRYVVTVVTLGGNYQAAPITRAFQITK